MKIKIEINEKVNSDINELLKKATTNSKILNGRTPAGSFDISMLNNPIKFFIIEQLKKYIGNTESDVRDILLNDLVENEKKKYN